MDELQGPRSGEAAEVRYLTVNSKLPQRENESWNDMKNIFHDVTGSFNSKRAHPSFPGIVGRL